MSLICVSSASRTSAVAIASEAGAIAGMIRDHEPIEVQAIDPSAVNQAIKAIAVADGYLQSDAEPLALVCIPSLVDLLIDDKLRTAVRLLVRPANLQIEE